MGELIRFPGAQVDYDFLDSFEWSDDRLRGYAARARFLADRYGRSSPLASLPRWPRGRCQDCRQAPAGRSRAATGWAATCSARRVPRPDSASGGP